MRVPSNTHYVQSPQRSARQASQSIHHGARRCRPPGEHVGALSSRFDIAALVPIGLGCIPTPTPPLPLPLPLPLTRCCAASICSPLPSGACVSWNPNPNPNPGGRTSRYVGLSLGCSLSGLTPSFSTLIHKKLFTSGTNYGSSAVLVPESPPLRGPSPPTVSRTHRNGRERTRKASAYFRQKTTHPARLRSSPEGDTQPSGAHKESVRARAENARRANSYKDKVDGLPQIRIAGASKRSISKWV